MKTEWYRYRKIAESNEIEYETWYKRVRRGWHPEAAATRPQQYQTRYVVIDGIEGDMSEHCQRIGLNVKTVKSRMRQYKITFEQSVELSR